MCAPVGNSGHTGESDSTQPFSVLVTFADRPHEGFDRCSSSCALAGFSTSRCTRQYQTLHGHALISTQVRALVFHASPQPLDKHIIPPRAAPRHRSSSPYQRVVCTFQLLDLVLKNANNAARFDQIFAVAWATEHTAQHLNLYDFR